MRVIIFGFVYYIIMGVISFIGFIRMIENCLSSIRYR